MFVIKSPGATRKPVPNPSERFWLSRMSTRPTARAATPPASRYLTSMSMLRPMIRSSPYPSMEGFEDSTARPAVSVRGPSDRVATAGGRTPSRRSLRSTAPAGLLRSLSAETASGAGGSALEPARGKGDLVTLRDAPSNPSTGLKAWSVRRADSWSSSRSDSAGIAVPGAALAVFVGGSMGTVPPFDSRRSGTRSDIAGSVKGAAAGLRLIFVSSWLGVTQGSRAARSTAPCCKGTGVRSRSIHHWTRAVRKHR